ncbi:MAG: secretin N-terminal domain-containing protein [Candidatus Omnitrophota bacterium]
MDNKMKKKNKGLKLLLVGIALFMFYYSGVIFAQDQNIQLPEENLNSSDVSSVITKPSSKEMISLDLKGVNVVELLRILSIKTGKNIVPSQGVTGRVSIFLTDVHINDALDIILSSQNLARENRGDIIYIMTAGEYKALYGRNYVEKREHKSIKLTYAAPANVFNTISQLKSEIGNVIVDEASGTIILIDVPEKLKIMEQAIKQLDAPLETVAFDLNYADPKEVQKRLAEIVTPGAGKVVIDERASKVIVTDLSSAMEHIKEMIKNFDEPEREVFIEAEIIQVSLNDANSRGIDWSAAFSKSFLNGVTLLGENAVDTPVSTSGKISIGTIDTNDYSAVVNFLKLYGTVDILSRPRIAAVNNQEAKILVGKRDAFVTQTTSQGAETTITSESVEFIDVGVKLHVVPTINKDGFVTLRIKPEVSSVSSTITTSIGSRIPIVETSEAETVVKIKDGTMIMIAGLIREQVDEEHSAFPGLEKLPFLGTFFQSHKKEIDKTELVIFITPHIITGENKLPGHEIEDVMPKRMMTPDIKKEIIFQEMDKIKPLPGDVQNEPNAKPKDLNKEVKGLKEI